MQYSLQTEKVICTVLGTYDTYPEARAAYDGYTLQEREALGLRIITHRTRPAAGGDR